MVVYFQNGKNKPLRRYVPCHFYDFFACTCQWSKCNAFNRLCQKTTGQHMLSLCYSLHVHMIAVLPFSDISCEVSKLPRKLSWHLNSHLHHSISERKQKQESRSCQLPTPDRKNRLFFWKERNK